jgi:hypothetical protein
MQAPGTALETRNSKLETFTFRLCHSNQGHVGCGGPAAIHAEQPIRKRKQNVMGDKSPKSVHKKAAQKQIKTDAASQKKHQNTAARQVPGKK